MKRSELEKDVAFILDAFKEFDYEIPSNRDILKVIFSKLIIVYALQVIFIVVDVFFIPSLVSIIILILLFWRWDLMFFLVLYF